MGRIAPCGSYDLVSGIGRHRTRTGRGRRARRFASASRRSPKRPLKRAWFRPTRSTTATNCCCSTRWPRQRDRRACGRPPDSDRVDVPVARARQPQPGGAVQRARCSCPRPTRAARMWPGCWPGTRSRGICSRPAIGCASESRRSPERSRTTSSSGSRTAVRSSPATRSSTSARASRSRLSGYLTE